MEKHKVSIIIPVYNAEKYLNKCLDSIFTQSYQNIEVICINDGSTDSSKRILDLYKLKYSDKMFFKTIDNSGQANARNKGLELSTGEFVMFVDSDDCIDINMIEQMMIRQNKNNADMVICGIDRIFDGNFSSKIKNFKYDTPLAFHELATIYSHPEILCFITFAPYAKLIKRDFLLHNNISFVKGYIYEDLMFTQQLLSNNPTIENCENKYYKYYVRENTTMTSKASKVTDMFFAFDKLYSYYVDNKINEKFKEELDFLCLFHVMIGTSFRMWQSNQFGLFKSIATCRRFVSKYNCNKNNKYLKEKGFIANLFVKLFV